MITTTWTKAPADLLGLGSFDVRRCAGIAVSPAHRPQVVPVMGTGVPVGATAARLRPAFQKARTEVRNQNWALAHNSIGTDDGTTLGICSSRRPLS
jgi:hypothetical protein